MASDRHVLVLGGNGKISRLLTVMLLKKSWTVTSLIRNPDQIDDLKKISEGLPGTHKIIVHDLIKIDSQEKAAAVIDEVKPDSVVFSAGRLDLDRVAAAECMLISKQGLVGELTKTR